MNKYLFFILFGIILFLIYNSIEGLNIGDRCDHINDPPNICNLPNPDKSVMEGKDITCNYPKGVNLCKCIELGTDEDPDSRCVLNTTINTYMIAKNIDDSCIVEENCTLANQEDINRYEGESDDNINRDICYDNCSSLSSKTMRDNCRNYHKNIRCRQLCDLDLILDPSDKNLNNSGFEKISQFLDTTPTCRIYDENIK